MVHDASPDVGMNYNEFDIPTSSSASVHALAGGHHVRDISVGEAEEDEVSSGSD